MKKGRGQRVYQKPISYCVCLDSSTSAPPRKMLSRALSSMVAGPTSAVLTDGCQDPCLSAQGQPRKLVTAPMQQGHLVDASHEGTDLSPGASCPPSSPTLFLNRVGPPAPRPSEVAPTDASGAESQGQAARPGSILPSRPQRPVLPTRLSLQHPPQGFGTGSLCSFGPDPTILINSFIIADGLADALG